MAVSYEGKKVLVTGGTSGFGKGFVHGFQALGATVTYTGMETDHTPYEGMEYRPVQFTDRADTKAFADWAAEQLFDVLVNNAGINIFADICDLDPDAFRKVQMINLEAPMMICRAVTPGMKKRGYGRVVNISSILGKVSRVQNAAYSASKYGIDGMTISMAADLAPYNVLMNCVAPGFFLTEMTYKLHDEADRARLAGLVPIKRLGQIPELVEFVTWLASDRNTYIVAQNIAIDGGITRIIQ